MLFVAPVPGGDDDVALEPLRPRRLGMGELALGYAIGPFRIVFDRDCGELARQNIDHQLARLPGLDAVHPRLGG